MFASTLNRPTTDQTFASAVPALFERQLDAVTFATRVANTFDLRDSVPSSERYGNLYTANLAVERTLHLYSPPCLIRGTIMVDSFEEPIGLQFTEHTDTCITGTETLWIEDFNGNTKYQSIVPL